MYRILHPRILMIGGDPDSPESPLRAISKVGVNGRLAFARFGDEAVRAIQFAQRSGLPHLVVLDFQPPAHAVAELVGHLRADPRTAVTPLVVIAPPGQAAEAIAAVGCGEDYYIAKPVDPMALELVMRRVGDYWLQGHPELLS
jgi:CheY-like chemotaxis protein